MPSRFLLPDGEIDDGVRAILPDQDWQLFSEVRADEDLSAVEFYVPPYLGGPAILDILHRLTGLRVIQLLTAGVDWIVPRVPRGVLLCRAVGVHEASVAEYVLASVLAMTKEIPAFVRFQAYAEWSHRRVGGLAGQRAVVLGHGAIGRVTGSLLEAFGVHVAGVTRSGRPPTSALSGIRELLPSCDILVIILPLTDETEHLVGEEMLGMLPDGALVVNVLAGPSSSGSRSSASSFLARLRAALDVTDPEPLPRDSPLWKLPNVLITPHVGGDSALFPRFASQLVAAQMQRYVGGLPLEHQVVGTY